MKKFIALFVVLAASACAQAQGLADHPNARNDRMPSAAAAEQHGTQAYRRADGRADHRAAHRKAKHHRKHARKHHKA